MNELQTAGELPDDFKKRLARIDKTKDIDKLAAMFEEAFFTATHGMIEMAVIAYQIDQADETREVLSELARKLKGTAELALLRKVGCGQVIAELAAEFRGTDLLRRAVRVPLSDQRRIALGEPFKVMDPDGEHRMVPPADATGRVLKQVFASDHIRDDTEQAHYLLDQAAKEKAKAPPNNDRYTLDKKNKAMCVRGVRIPLAEILEIVKALASK